MTMQLLSSQLTDAIQSGFPDHLDELLVVDPAESVLAALIQARFESDELPTLAIVATKERLKSTLDAFSTAAKAAALIDEETLSLRQSAAVAGNALLISETSAVAIVQTSDGIATIPADEPATIDAIYTTARTRFDEASQYTIRTPSLTRLQTAMTDEFGVDFQADFEMAINAIGTSKSINGASLLVLLGAKHERLFYDISTWGEDMGIASRATFSRTKQTLEDDGVIETEKVPIDVGRPRLRLLLADEQLTDRSVSELLDIDSVR